MIKSIFLLAFSLLLSFSAKAVTIDNPVRTGLGFKALTAPKFNDEQILTAIKHSVENASVGPILRIKIDGSADKIAIIVVGDDHAQQFSFTVVDGQAVAQKGVMTETITYQVEVPFGSVKAYGFKNYESFDYSGTAGWIAVGVVGVYAAKKILNKMTIGSFSASQDHEHDSLFPTNEQMRLEMIANRDVMNKALAKAEEALDGQILEIVQPLAVTAACGHDHGLTHQHKPSGFKCEAIDQEQAVAAQKVLLTGFTGYATAFGKDFYNELISPVVGLVKAVKDRDTRSQIWNFFDLISRRMIKERGVGAAVATGVFVGTGQVVIEVLESFVMPAGAHLFCQVGNAAVLAVAAKTYTTYFCMTQHKEFKDKSVADRWRVAQQISRLSKVNAVANGDEEKTIHALNLLFRLVERDVRHARNLDDLGKPESRELARRLGALRRELTILSIRILNKTNEDGEALSWLKELYGVQSILGDAQACADLLEPAA